MSSNVSETVIMGEMRFSTGLTGLIYVQSDANITDEWRKRRRNLQLSQQNGMDISMAPRLVRLRKLSNSKTGCWMGDKIILSRAFVFQVR
jgi:hypothetical protein